MFTVSQHYAIIFTVKFKLCWQVHTRYSRLFPPFIGWLPACLISHVGSFKYGRRTMGVIQRYNRILKSLSAYDMNDFRVQWNMYQAVCAFIADGGADTEDGREFILKWTKYLKFFLIRSVTTNDIASDAYWGVLLVEAKLRVFDSYCLYLEKNRDDDKKFYEPRRKQFLSFGLVQSIQDLLDDKVNLLTISMPPGSGKSTAGIFLLSGVMGWWPEMPNLASAHSGILTRSFYDGVGQILTDPYEYTWREIFPDVEFNPRSGMNSKEQTINVGKPNRFKSLTCRAIGASLTGATRCEKILYADDLCSGIEEAMSKERLDKLWQTYNTDLKTRKKDKCKEIHIATRWSVNDVIGHLQREHEHDPMARFVSVPAFDKNGESNFNYKYGVGFSTQYFKDMQMSMDDVSFRCLYMNEPIEREGLLYHDADLKRYLTLPDREPDAVWSCADTKNKGTDFFAQPVFYQFGDDYYMVDTICDDNSDYEVQYEKSANLLYMYHVQAAKYESNNSGDRVAAEVSKRLEEKKGFCNITTEYTTQNKETKIYVYAPWVKQHVLFRDESLYSPKDDYGKFMTLLLTYSVAGKNTHDDPPDVMAQFASWRTVPEDVPTVVGARPF